MREKCLCANKFNLDVDPAAVLCQAKDLVLRTEVQLMRGVDNVPIF